MSSPPKVINKVGKTDDGMFTFNYEFEYGAQQVNITVTILCNETSASPPSAPHVFHFGKGAKINISKFETPDNYWIKGEMNIVHLPAPIEGDDAGIWCNIFYGHQEHSYHFEGVMVTYKQTLTGINPKK